MSAAVMLTSAGWVSCCAWPSLDRWDFMAGVGACLASLVGGAARTRWGYGQAGIVVAVGLLMAFSVLLPVERQGLGALSLIVFVLGLPLYAGIGWLASRVMGRVPRARPVVLAVAGTLAVVGLVVVVAGWPQPRKELLAALQQVQLPADLQVGEIVSGGNFLDANHPPYISFTARIRAGGRVTCREVVEALGRPPLGLSVPEDRIGSESACFVAAGFGGRGSRYADLVVSARRSERDGGSFSFKVGFGV